VRPTPQRKSHERLQSLPHSALCRSSLIQRERIFFYFFQTNWFSPSSASLPCPPFPFFFWDFLSIANFGLLLFLKNKFKKKKNKHTKKKRSSFDTFYAIAHLFRLAFQVSLGGFWGGLKKKINSLALSHSL